jgi:DNA-binding NarL/FixJ family response regulator
MRAPATPQAGSHARLNTLSHSARAQYAPVEISTESRRSDVRRLAPRDRRMITVAIIDDRPLVREGLTAMLAALPDVEVVLAATDADPAMLKLADPRIVLLDAGREKQHAVRMATGLQQELAAARVIVMNVLPGNEGLADFVHAGAAGFILADASFDDLIGAIRSVAGGAQVIPTPMSETLFRQIAGGDRTAAPARAADAVHMTPREHQVIVLIGLGMSNKEIAQRLLIAPDTVKSHVRKVMDKLAVHSRLQIAAYAHNQSA